MREYGQFLLSAQALDNKIIKLDDLINPEQFQLCLATTRRATGFNESTLTYNTPSLAVQLGQS